MSDARVDASFSTEIFAGLDALKPDVYNKALEKNAIPMADLDKMFADIKSHLLIYYTSLYDPINQRLLAKEIVKKIVSETNPENCDAVMREIIRTLKEKMKSGEVNDSEVAMKALDKIEKEMKSSSTKVVKEEGRLAYPDALAVLKGRLAEGLQKHQAVMVDQGELIDAMDLALKNVSTMNSEKISASYAKVDAIFLTLGTMSKKYEEIKLANPHEKEHAHAKITEISMMQNPLLLFGQLLFTWTNEKKQENAIAMVFDQLKAVDPVKLVADREKINFHRDKHINDEAISKPIFNFYEAYLKNFPNMKINKERECVIDPLCENLMATFFKNHLKNVKDADIVAMYDSLSNMIGILKEIQVYHNERNEVVSGYQDVLAPKINALQQLQNLVSKNIHLELKLVIHAAVAHLDEKMKDLDSRLMALKLDKKGLYSDNDKKKILNIEKKMLNLDVIKGALDSFENGGIALESLVNVFDAVVKNAATIKHVGFFGGPSDTVKEIKKISQLFEPYCDKIGRDYNMFADQNTSVQSTNQNRPGVL